MSLNLLISVRYKVILSSKPGTSVWFFQLGFVFSILNTFISNPGGTRWCSWLRHSATGRKVAGSISDGVTGIFLTQPLTEMSTRNISCCLEIWKPQGLSRPVMRLLYLYRQTDAPYMQRPSHHTWLDRRSIIRCSVHVTKLSTTHCLISVRQTLNPQSIFVPQSKKQTMQIH